MLVDALDPKAVIDLAADIQRIPAPTFSELKRAQFVYARFGEAGLADVTCITDGGGVTNVYGTLPGADRSLPCLLVSAHTDTVFDADTDLATRYDPATGRLYGPGIGDNSIAVAALIHLASVAVETGLHPAGDVVFLANAREEGLGNLDGINAAIARFSPAIGSAIVLEGLSFGLVYNRGIAVRRLHVSANTAGGHSWGAFGKPSAVHVLAALVTAITTLTVPSEPKTTYNVGVIRGGRSVNTIADEAEMWVDLRSAEREALEDLETRVRCEIGKVAGDGEHVGIGDNQLDASDNGPGADVSIAVEVVGDRPAGSIPDDHPLVIAACRALESVGCTAKLSAGSTDVNALLAAGIPAVCVGITTGDNAHCTDEYINTGTVGDGIRQLAHLVMLVYSSSVIR